MVHYNVQSLLPKPESIECELSNVLSADCIALTETWLNQSIPNNDICIHGSNQFNATTGRTIVTLVLQFMWMKLYSKRRSDLEIHDVKCVWIEISIKHNPVLFRTFNKPPN